jgi:hypothetical protein
MIQLNASKYSSTDTYVLWICINCALIASASSLFPAFDNASICAFQMHYNEERKKKEKKEGNMNKEGVRSKLEMRRMKKDGYIFFVPTWCSNAGHTFAVTEMTPSPPGRK